MWRRETDIEAMIRQSAEAFADARHSTARTRQCAASTLGYDAAIWKEMADLGWTGLLLPQVDGGSELPLSAALVLAETFGRRLLPEPFVASAVLAGTVLAGAGGAAARPAAEALARGETAIALAHREGDLADDACGLATTAVADDDGVLRIDGRKSLVPSWQPGCPLLVTSIQAGQMQIHLVSSDAEGVSAAPRRMADGSVAADILFHSVAVSPEQGIASGNHAEELLDRATAYGLLAASAQLEGLAQSMLRMTIDYTDQRVQFDRPLGANQALRHALVDLFAQVEMAGATWRSAAARLDRDGISDAAGSISVAKARCSDAALAMSRAAIQYHGAFGYTEEADVGLFVNATLRLSSWMGNASSHRDLALRAHERGSKARA